MLNHAAVPYTPASEIGLAVPGDPVVPHHVSPSRKKFLVSRKSPPESRPLELSPEIEALIDARIQQSQMEDRKFFMKRMVELYKKNKDKINTHQEWLEDIATQITCRSCDIRILRKRIDTVIDW